MAGVIRVRECSCDDVAELFDVTHVEAAHCRIDGQYPAKASVRLLLRRI